VGMDWILGLVRLLLLLGSIGFLVWVLVRSDYRLPAGSTSLVFTILAGLFLLLSSVVLLALLWIAILRHLSGPTPGFPWAALTRAFARSWLARYLPGSAWAYGARFLYTDASMMPRRILAVSLVNEFLLVTGTSAALALSTWLWSTVGLVAGLTALASGTIILSSLTAWANPMTRTFVAWLGDRIGKRSLSSLDRPRQRVAARRLTHPASLVFSTGYLATNAGVAASFALGVVALTPDQVHDFAQLMASYSIATLVGTAVIFAPAGIGVREASLIGLLSASVSASVVVVAAVAVRLGLAVADVALFVAAEIWAGSGNGRRRDRSAPGSLAGSAMVPPSRLGSLYRTELLQHVGLTEVHGRVVDIGGFDGYLSTRFPGRLTFVADIEPQAVYDWPVYVRADARRLPFRDGSFDRAFALDLIEHVDGEHEAISEALRILKPGGLLILSTPDADISVFPRFLQPVIDRQWGHDRVRGYRREELSQFFDSTPISEIQLTSLRTGALRLFYLPLSILWRLPGPLGPWLVSLAARWDGRHLEGEGGYLLVRAVRAPEPPRKEPGAAFVPPSPELDDSRAEDR
jgi:SAM-dependent methyltransferase/uncharacterized membrane protein YbhN (UPF0104 family)